MYVRQSTFVFVQEFFLSSNSANCVSCKHKKTHKADIMNLGWQKEIETAIQQRYKEVITKTMQYMGDITDLAESIEKSVRHIFVN